METSSVPPTLGKNFDKTVKESARALAQLKKQIVRLDPTLAGAVDGAEENLVSAGKIEAQSGEGAGAESRFDCRASRVSRIASVPS